MKNQLIIGMLLLLLLTAGCTSSNPQSTNTENNGANTGTTTGETKSFTMTASQFEFSPSTITVNQGDTVVLTITSSDVTHGFSLPEFGVSENLEPGQTVSVQFVADKKGTFTFSCSVFCGSGHSSMKGTLKVQ